MYLLAPRPLTPSGPHSKPRMVIMTRGRKRFKSAGCWGGTEAAARIPEAQQYSLVPWALAGLKL